MSADMPERCVAGLVVRIDRDLCVGFGDCIDLAPDLFAFDESGVVAFREASVLARQQVIAACTACPVDALVVLEADGTMLVP